MRRKRSNKGLTRKGSNKEGLTDKRTQHLAEALIAPAKRARLIMISKALDKPMQIWDKSDWKAGKAGEMVRYGIGGYTFQEIGQLL